MNFPLPLTLIITYVMLILLGIYFLKRYYSDNECVGALPGALYILLFSWYISQILTIFGRDPFNLPFISIISVPVGVISATFFSNFFTQFITVREFFQENIKFHFLDHLSLAMTSLRNQDYRNAVEHYRRFLESHPEDFQVYMEIAEIHALYLNDYRSAIGEYENALRLSGKSLYSISILNRLADIYFARMNRADLAGESLKEIVKSWPGTDAAHRAAERIEGMAYFFDR